MKAHDGAQLVIAKVLGHQAVNAAPCAHFEEGGDGFDQVTQGVKGDRTQTFKAQCFAALGILYKVQITLHVFGCKFGHLVQHLGFVR